MKITGYRIIDIEDNKVLFRLIYADGTEGKLNCVSVGTTQDVEGLIRDIAEQEEKKAAIIKPNVGLGFFEFSNKTKKNGVNPIEVETSKVIK